MDARNTEISLAIKNNTPFPLPINILGSINSPNSANNIHNLYYFDLTGENFGTLVSVTIEISDVNNPTVIPYTVTPATLDIKGVVDALNTLNKGLFYTYGNFIFTASDFYIYGALTSNSASLPFISNWNTINTSFGSSLIDQIQLPLESTGTYNFTVDWGDGNIDTITAWNQAETIHTYATVGTYTITIQGTIQGWRFNGNGDRNKFLSVDSWGVLQLGNSGAYFRLCENLDLSTVSDALNLTGTTNMGNSFLECTSLTSINNANSWDFSGVTTTTNMFNFTTLFNGDISGWDMSSVLATDYMFQDAPLFNQPIGSWNVSNVVNMESMFAGALAFNQPIGSWNTSSATNMSTMFYNAPVFNQDISSWNVSSVTNMSYMFGQALAFNQPIGSWNVSNVVDVNNMFNQATAFNQPINSWNISNATNMSGFMANKTNLDYSASYLTAIYNSWSLLPVQPNIIISFGTIKYTGAGAGGKALLTTSPYPNWTITDGGI